MPKIALSCGYISQNVGNAFFELGALELLGRAVGRQNVSLIGDNPAHWTSNRKSKGRPEGGFNWLERMNGIDYLVLQGPELTKNIGLMWDETFTALKRRNIQPIFMSVSFSEYSDSERNTVLQFLQKHEVPVLSTRDSATFQGLQTANPFYDGICSAWFMPWACEPIHLDGRFIASTFESRLEPKDLVAAHLEGRNPFLKESEAPVERLLGRSSALDYLVHLSPLAKAKNAEASDLDVIRPVHRTNPALPSRIFRDHNHVASDEPFTYLSVYKSAEATYTDRVHAAVASLVFGTPAMLTSKSGRAALLERVGIKLPMLQLATLDEDRLANERELQFEAVKRFFE